MAGKHLVFSSILFGIFAFDYFIQKDVSPKLLDNNGEKNRGKR